MPVKARVSCVRITDFGAQREVVMQPVTTSQDDDPNKSYSRWTPSGELKLMITNPDAFNQFAVGKIYDVDFTERETAAARADLEPQEGDGCEDDARRPDRRRAEREADTA